MFRLLICAVAGLLLTGSLSAQEKDKKPDAKPDVVKEKNADAPRKAAKDEVKKDAPDGQKKVVKEGAKGDGGGTKGKLSRIAVDGGTLKVTVDGKEFEFPVTDSTFAALRTVERDGKQVVVGLQLFGGADVPKGDGAKKELLKKDEVKKDRVKKDAPKDGGDKPTDKPKDK